MWSGAICGDGDNRGFHHSFNHLGKDGSDQWDEPFRLCCLHSCSFFSHSPSLFRLFPPQQQVYNHSLPPFFFFLSSSTDLFSWGGGFFFFFPRYIKFFLSPFWFFLLCMFLQNGAANLHLQPVCAILPVGFNGVCFSLSPLSCTNLTPICLYMLNISKPLLGGEPMIFLSEFKLLWWIDKVKKKKQFEYYVKREGSWGIFIPSWTKSF